LVVCFKGKIGIIKKSSQKFVSFLYIVIDIKLIKVIKKKIENDFADITNASLPI
jgi:hypothetical protein